MNHATREDVDIDVTDHNTQLEIIGISHIYEIDAKYFGSGEYEVYVYDKRTTPPWESYFENFLDARKFIRNQYPDAKWEEVEWER